MSLEIPRCTCPDFFKYSGVHVKVCPYAPKATEEIHVCPQDESGLCDDCPCHTPSDIVKAFIQKEKDASFKAGLEIGFASEKSEEKLSYRAYVKAHKEGLELGRAEGKKEAYEGLEVGSDDWKEFCSSLRAEGREEARKTGLFAMGVAEDKSLCLKEVREIVEALKIQNHSAQAANEIEEVDERAYDAALNNLLSKLQEME